MPSHLILYDGVCGLCNATVQFVLPRDTRGLFAFASLQSATGRSMAQRFGRNPDDLDTFYLVMNYRTESPEFLMKSAAALKVASLLGQPWRLMAGIGVLPRVLTDAVYHLVARHRYRMFGRYDTCPLPRPEQRARFIDV